ncbi:MAG: hypothetical protein DMF56_05705 [Acidobacteria bacterium]|nr:MAG: hypothetical protein DMF56_05705 [Acidobacteriota bacterium]
MITAPAPPPEVLAVLRDPARAGLHEDTVRLAPIHRVFTATLADVLAGRVLNAAQESAWRDVTAGAAAEVASRNGEFVITSINEGPFVAATADALETARQLDGDYELRVLSIPAVYVVALWLYADAGSILIPLSPAPSGLTANQPYNESSFTEALRPLAEKRSTTPMV